MSIINKSQVTKRETVTDVCMASKSVEEAHTLWTHTNSTKKVLLAWFAENDDSSRSTALGSFTNLTMIVQYRFHFPKELENANAVLLYRCSFTASGVHTRRRNACFLWSPLFKYQSNINKGFGSLLPDNCFPVCAFFVLVFVFHSLPTSLRLSDFFINRGL